MSLTLTYVAVDKVASLVFEHANSLSSNSSCFYFILFFFFTMNALSPAIWLANSVTSFLCSISPFLWKLSQSPYLILQPTTPLSSYPFLLFFLFKQNKFFTMPLSDIPYNLRTCYFYCWLLASSWASLVAQTVQNPPAIWETWVICT